MKARTAPTSPAAKNHDAAVTKVWTDGQIQQPPKVPWGRLVLMVVLVTLLLNVATVAAFGWYVHRYPQTWLARFAPLTSTTTTTVVQSAKDTATSSAPAAVQQLLSSAYGLARNQGQTGVYRDSDVLGLAWPLSGSGWAVSVSGAWPADVKSLVLVPAVGQTQAVTSIVADPGSQFIFLKSTEIRAQPITIATTDEVDGSTTLWVIDNHGAVSRHETQRIEPRWASSDLDETYTQLDGPVTAAVGSAVVTSEGHFAGLLGVQGRVWSLNSLSSVLKQVIQTAAVSRPVLGLRSLNQATARIVGQPSATGFLIGADSGDVAVTSKGPADKAGLKAGDIITEVDGQVPSQDLLSWLSKYRPGDKMNITYIRQQKEKTVSVTLGSTRT